MSILRNAAKCLACGDEIESIHRHDFVTCSCGNLSVDGGKDYVKRCFGKEPWENRSEYQEEVPKDWEDKSGSN